MTDNDEGLDEALSYALAIAAGRDAEFLLQEGGAFTALLDKARADALAALSDLINTDFTDLKDVRQRQWEATRYGDLCRYIREIIDAAELAGEIMSDDEADYVRETYSRGETEPQDA